MGHPISLDIPHNLGKAGVRARLDGGIGKLGTMIPGGATVSHGWQGDDMVFTVKAMGQEIASRVTIYEDKVHAVVDLPAFLGAVRRQGPRR